MHAVGLDFKKLKMKKSKKKKKNGAHCFVGSSTPVHHGYLHAIDI